MWEFVRRYFVDPIIYGTGYNPVNTVTYAILFVVISMLIYKLLPKRIKIDKKFMLSSVPYILLGATLRVLEDASVLKSFVFVTPFVWLLLASYAFIMLYISFLLNEKEYYKIWSALGILPLVIFFTFIHIRNPIYLGEIILATAISSMVAYLISRPFKVKEMYLIFVHMFDASTTFVALSTGRYFEEHVVGGVATNIFGPAGMYILKIPVLIFVLKSLEKEPKKLRNYIYLLILILGLGPGTRNMLRLLMGV